MKITSSAAIGFLGLLLVILCGSSLRGQTASEYFTKAGEFLAKQNYEAALYGYRGALCKDPTNADFKSKVLEVTFIYAKQQAAESDDRGRMKYQVAAGIIGQTLVMQYNAQNESGGKVSSFFTDEEVKALETSRAIYLAVDLAADATAKATDTLKRWAQPRSDYISILNGDMNGAFYDFGKAMTLLKQSGDHSILDTLESKIAKWANAELDALFVMAAAGPWIAPGRDEDTLEKMNNFGLKSSATERTGPIVTYELGCKVAAYDEIDPIISNLSKNFPFLSLEHYKSQLRFKQAKAKAAYKNEQGRELVFKVWLHDVAAADQSELYEMEKNLTMAVQYFKDALTHDEESEIIRENLALAEGLLDRCRKAFDEKSG